MSQNRSPEQYQAAFEAIAGAVRQLPDEQRKQIGEQLGEYTHDFKHLLGLVTGANAVLLRVAPADEKGDKMLEMVETIDKASVQLNAYIDMIVSQLYMPIRPESDDI